MYRNDIATIPVNLAGLPAMSIPSGVSAGNLPIGFQIIAPGKEDARLYRVGAALEKAVAERDGAILDRLPRFGRTDQNAGDNSGKGEK
jgi:aspartyl-tRNA(Asn)/glutamyl-tRNA(Gln) amidotransferase subunit A